MLVYENFFFLRTYLYDFLNKDECKSPSFGGCAHNIPVCVRIRVLHVDVFHVLNSIMNQQGALLHDMTG